MMRDTILPQLLSPVWIPDQCHIISASYEIPNSVVKTSHTIDATSALKGTNRPIEVHRSVCCQALGRQRSGRHGKHDTKHVQIMQRHVDSCLSVRGPVVFFP